LFNGILTVLMLLPIPCTTRPSLLIVPPPLIAPPKRWSCDPFRKLIDAPVGIVRVPPLICNVPLLMVFGPSTVNWPPVCTSTVPLENEKVDPDWNVRVPPEAIVNVPPLICHVAPL